MVNRSQAPGHTSWILVVRRAFGERAKTFGQRDARRLAPCHNLRKLDARTFHQLVSKYPADVQRLASAARAFIYQILPGVQERVDDSQPYVGYGYSPGYKGLCCTLILSKGGVKLGIVSGAALADPEGLLEGTGKRHRHIALRTPADLHRGGVQALVRAAGGAARQRNA